MDEIINLIGNYAFPIAMCGYMVYINEKQDLRHQEEVKELSKVIETNTTVLETIREHIRKDG